MGAIFRFGILKELINDAEIRERCNKAKTWKDVYKILIKEARKRGHIVRNVRGSPVVG
jgi:ribosomal protein L18E